MFVPATGGRLRCACRDEGFHGGEEPQAAWTPRDPEQVPSAHSPPESGRALPQPPPGSPRRHLRQALPHTSPAPGQRRDDPGWWTQTCMAGLGRRRSREPGHSSGPRRIDTEDLRPCQGTPQKPAVKHVRQGIVNRVQGSSLDLLEGIYPGYRLSDHLCLETHEVSPSKTVPKKKVKVRVRGPVNYKMKENR